MRALRSAIPLVFTALGAIALFLLLRHLPTHVLAGAIRDPKLLALGVLGPPTITFLADTIAWWLCFPDARRLAFHRVLFIRVGGEALTNVLPGGVVVGEVWKLSALSRRYGFAGEEALGSLALAKVGLAASQLVFVVTGLTLGFRATAEAGSRTSAGVVLTAIAFAVMFLGPVVVLVRWHARRKGPPEPAADGSSALNKLWIRGISVAYRATDDAVTAVKTKPRAVASAALLSLLGWFVGVFETWLVLHALGAPIALRDAIVIESLGSVFRMVFFLAPGGLGAQDWGLAALLGLLRVPNAIATGAAFALVRRGREALWISAGLVICAIVALTRHRDAAAASDIPRSNA